jgi:hypothetical protein
MDANCDIEFYEYITHCDRLRIRISRDIQGQVTNYHVGLEVDFSPAEAIEEDWCGIKSYDCAHGKNHGHKHSPDGSRARVAMPDLGLQESITWARETLKAELDREKERYAQERNTQKARGRS